MTNFVFRGAVLKVDEKLGHYSSFSADVFIFLSLLQMRNN